MSDDKLRASSMKDTFVSSSFVEKVSARPISTTFSRFDPFDSDSFLLNLKRIMKMDFCDDSAEPTEESVAEIVVRRALDRLPLIEKEVIVRYYFQGEVLSEIGKAIGKVTADIDTIRLRALERLKSIVVEEKHQLGLTADYNQCIICNHSSRKEIEQFVHVYLDNYGWKKQGLLRQLKKTYSITLSSVDLETHLGFHMVIPDYSELCDDLREKNSYHQLNVSVSSALIVDIDTLAKAYGVSSAFVVRYALQYGVKWLQVMLPLNDMMFVEQLKLNRIFKKLSI